MSDPTLIDHANAALLIELKSLRANGAGRNDKRVREIYDELHAGNERTYHDSFEPRPDYTDGLGEKAAYTDDALTTVHLDDHNFDEAPDDEPTDADVLRFLGEAWREMLQFMLDGRKPEHRLARLMSLCYCVGVGDLDQPGIASQCRLTKQRVCALVKEIGERFGIKQFHSLTRGLRAKLNMARKAREAWRKPTRKPRSTSGSIAEATEPVRETTKENEPTEDVGQVNATGRLIDLAPID